MSVGGKVVEIIVLPNKVWVDTKERPEYSGTCAIYVERTAESLCIEVGDSLWWQGDSAFWTPRRRDMKTDPPFNDKPLRRLGFSGVARPSFATAASS